MSRLIVLTMVALLVTGCAAAEIPTTSPIETAGVVSPTPTKKLVLGTAEASVQSSVEVSADEPSTTTPVATAISFATPIPPAATVIPSLTLSSNPFPALLAEISLAPEGETLVDLLVDSPGNRIYVTNSVGQLHVLDAADFASLATLPAGGKLTLNAENDLLFVSPVNGGQLTVVDTVALTVTGTISPGGAVAVDPARHRFYVGQGEPNTTVRVYDLSSFNQVGEITQPGLPVYSPVRDELYLQYLNVYIASSETLTVTGKVLPDLLAEEYGWCNECDVPDSVYLDLDRNVLAVDMHTIAAGKGRGLLAEPHLYDATTLEELTNWPYGVEEGCFNQIFLSDPIEGRIYRERFYSRYTFAVNLLVYDTDGGLLDWYSGVSLGRTNPRTKHMYSGAWVYGLDPFTPLGLLPTPVDCFGPMDGTTGRVYAVKDNRLLIYADDGGEPFVPSVLKVGSLTEYTPIGTLTFSPAYAEDRTVFMSGADIYRSRDEGQAWEKLPISGDLIPSPGFASDKILFALPGRGVFRSTDGGDTWQAAWNGLRHLNIFSLASSPDFASDSSLLAFARYQDLTGSGNSDGEQVALYRSTDRGDTWITILDRQDNDKQDWLVRLAQSPSAPVWFQTGTVSSTLTVERSQDQGQTWEVVFTAPQGSFFPGYRSPLVFSPNLATDQTLLLFSSHVVYRSADNGNTWQQVLVLPQDETYNSFESLVFSPNFDRDETTYAMSKGDLFRSADGGASWDRIFTVDDTGRSLTRLFFSPAYASDQTLYLAAMYALYRSEDNGQSWERVLTPDPSGLGESFDPYHLSLFSPTFGVDHMMYAYTNYRLLRSTDSGRTWQQWTDERLPGSESGISLGSLVVSPVRASGGHQLFIGTSGRVGPAYRFYVLNPDEMDWSGQTYVPAAYATPMPTPLPEVPVEAPYLDLWLERGGRFGPIGPAVAPATEAPYAIQLFENGLMHWGWHDGGTPYIHVLYYSLSTRPPEAFGSWERYEDTWQDSDGEYLCADAQPPYGPQRGFGKVWCACERCRERLGPPLGGEEGYTGGYQTFENAVMLWHRADNVLYWLRDDGVWSRYE